MKIAIISGVNWNHTFQRQQKTAIALKDLGHDVDFITGFKLRNPRFGDVFNIFKKKKFQKKTDLNLLKFNILPPSCYLFNLINKYIFKYKYNSLSSYDLIFTFLPHPVLKGLDDGTNIIYDCVRDFSEWGGYPDYLLNYEKKLIKEAEVVLFDSFWLENKIKKTRGNISMQILPTYPNVINDIKIKYDIPSKIASLCYYGSINEKIDINLLNKLSEKYPITLIGPISDNVKLSNNINHIEPMFNQADLFCEVMKYDAFIIPYVGNMNGVIPAKTTELLNLNKPTFISKFYDSVKLSNSWFVYETYDDLVDKITCYDSDNFFVKYKNNEKKFKVFKNENLTSIYQVVLSNINKV